MYLDSCIVIYQTEKIEPWAGRIGEALASLKTPEVMVSDLVRLECRVVPLRENALDVLRRFDVVFSSLTFVPLTRAVFDLAAELRARHRLKTPDALHLAAAIEHGCDEFWTNDDRLAAAGAAISMRVFS